MMRCSRQRSLCSITLRLIASPTGDKLADHLPEQSDWLVPTIVQLEMAKWPTREIGEDEADQVSCFTQVCRVVPLDTETTLAAAEACPVLSISWQLPTPSSLPPRRRMVSNF